MFRGILLIALSFVLVSGVSAGCRGGKVAIGPSCGTACDLLCSQPYTVVDFEKKLALYRPHGEVELRFSRSGRTLADEVEGRIVVPPSDFSVILRSPTGLKNPFGLEGFHTIFRIHLAGALRYDSVVSSFFCGDKLCLREKENVSLHFIPPAKVPAPGARPLTMSLTAYGSGGDWEKESGTCRFVPPYK